MRGAIFTRARVSLALLSLRKNGGLLVVYLHPSPTHSHNHRRRGWSMSWQTGEKVGFPNNLRCDISVIVPCQQSALCFKLCVKRTPKETLEEEGRVSYPPLTLPWSL